MTCPECDGRRQRLSVPEELTEHASEENDAVVVCTNCLRTWAPADAPDVPDGEASDVSDALPPDETAATGVLLAAALLSSLAHNQDQVEALFAAVEQAGADPWLVIERLADDQDLSPAVDIQRRLRQFEGLR